MIIEGSDQGEWLRIIMASFLSLSKKLTMLKLILANNPTLFEESADGDQSGETQ